MNNKLISEVMAYMGKKGGKKGGLARTDGKIKAARENGKLGGRPKGSKNRKRKG